jgi:AcrR family transcriptional regulator
VGKCIYTRGSLREVKVRAPITRPRRRVLPQNTLKRAPSLRDEHKAHTERTLRAAALKLFASQGYDTTTVEEVAESAGVSARTFFRYFPTKESVLYAHEHIWFQSMTEIYLAQPRSRSDIEALSATLVEFSSDLVPRRRSLQLYRRALVSSPTLRGRQQDRHVEEIDELAKAVAARRGLSSHDEGCALVAATALLTHRRALDAWLAQGNLDLGEVISEEFEILIAQFSRRPTAKATAAS